MSKHISGHAVDRASLTPVREIWRRDRQKDEGLHTWLRRVADEAWTGEGKVEHKGMRLAFSGPKLQVLVTIGVLDNWRSVLPEPPTKRTPEAITNNNGSQSAENTDAKPTPTQKEEK